MIFKCQMRHSDDAPGHLTVPQAGADNVPATGLISLIGALAILVTAGSWVRDNHYKVFYRAHITGFLLFIGAAGGSKN